MDNLDAKIVRKMDRLYENDYREREKEQRSYENTRDFQAQVEQNRLNLQENLKKKEDFVQKEIFGGELEKDAQEQGMDYTHNYVYEEAEKTVTRLNQSVAKKIEAFGSAEIERHGSIEDEEKLNGPINKPPKDAGWKKRTFEKWDLKDLQKRNKNADLVTLRESKALDTYNKFKIKTGNMDENGNIENPVLAGITRGLSEEDKRNMVIKMKMEAIPFCKMYKKGWFGRLYTLDGKRITTAPGEKTPDEYNKELLETLALDTEHGQEKDRQVIEENRIKKGKLIASLAKELLSVKITQNMLTDEYMTEHFGEMHQYGEKLNAFRNIMGSNPWFLGSEKKGKDAKADGGDQELEANTLDNKFLADIIYKRIFYMADYFNLFMDKHLAAHGMYRAGRFEYKQNGFIKDGYDPEFNIIQAQEKFDERHQGSDIKTIERSAEKINKNLTKVKGYRMDERLNVVSPVVLFDESSLKTQEEKNEYNENVEWMKQDLEEIIKSSSRTFNNIYKDNLTYTDKLLNKVIDGTMQEFKQHSTEKYNEEKERSEKENDKLLYTEIPYDEYTNRDGGITIAHVREMIEKNSEMYLIYGPEIEHLYSRLYSSVCLSAELSARKASIKKELEADNNREESVFNYKINNKYSAELNDFVSEEIKNGAKNADKVIDKKLSYLKENNAIIMKTLRFFLKGPSENGYSAEDLAQIEGFLKKEKLSHMFEVTKIDTYSDMMDDVTFEMDKIIAKADNGDADIAGMAKHQKIITTKERALNVFNVRKRVRRQSKNAEEYEKRTKDRKDYRLNEEKGDIQVLMSNVGVNSAYDLKDQINPKLGVSNVVDFIERGKLCREILAGKKKNRVNLNSAKSVRRIYDELKENTVCIKEGTSFAWYWAYVRAQMEITAEYSEAMEAMYKLEQHPAYPYFDMSRLVVMQDDQLAALKGVIEKKRDALKDDPKNQEKYEALKGFVEIITQFSEYRAIKNRVPEYSEQTITNRAREYYTEYRIKEEKEQTFRFADEKYLRIKDTLKGDATDTKTLVTAGNWLRVGTITRKEKGKALLDAEKTLLTKCSDFLSISIKDSTKAFEHLKNNPDVDRQELLKLGMDVSLIKSLADLMENEGNEEAPEYHKELLEILNREENLGTKEEILKKLAVLKPFAEAVYGYMGTYCMYPDGYNLFDVEWQQDSEKTDEQVKAEIDEYRKQSEAGYKEFEKSLSDYESGEMEKLIVEAKSQLFEDLYKSGEKLSIGDAEKWRKKISSMSKKGFLSVDNEKKKWYRMAALQILSHWPFSFEQFYAEKIKADTGKALTVTLKTLLGKDGAGLMTDEEARKAGEMSAYVSEQDMKLYHALSENSQNELNRILDANGYDKKLFKYIFKTVNTSGQNLPLHSEDREARDANELILDSFKSFAGMKKAERLKAAKEKDFTSFSYNVGEVIDSVLRSRFVKNFDPAALNEAFIGENFNEIYDLTRKAGFIDMIYEKNKELFEEGTFCEALNDEEVSKRFFELFGKKNNKILMRLKGMVDAYAAKNFIGEDGTFDIGLTNEDLVAAKDTTKDKKTRYKKVIAERDRRQAEFERNLGAVDAEYNRISIAEKTAESTEALNTIDNIRIGATDKLFSVQRPGRNGGHISDFGLLVQDEGLTSAIKNLNGYNSLIAEDKQKMSDYQAQIDKYTQDNKEVPQKLQFEMERSKSRFLNDSGNISRLKLNIGQYQNKAEQYYNIYQSCHDKEGRLKLERTDENGTKIDMTDTYIDFHVTLSQDMAGIFTDFVKMYGENGDNILSQKFIADLMKSKDFGKLYTDYKRFNLYTTILQRETEEGAYKGKKFMLLFSQESAQIKRLDGRTKALKKKSNEKRVEMVKLENQAKQADTRLKSLQDSLDKAKETEIKLVEEMKGAANNPKAMKKLTEKVQSNALLRAKLEGDVATAQEEKRALDVQVKNAQINSVMLENQVNEHEKAREMMKKVFEKNADKIGVFQDFVAQIETTLLQYGITADGELLSDEVRTAMNGMSEDEMFDFVHNVGDKAFDVTVARRQEKKGGAK